MSGFLSGFFGKRAVKPVKSTEETSASQIGLLLRQYDSSWNSLEAQYAHLKDEIAKTEQEYPAASSALNQANDRLRDIQTSLSSVVATVQTLQHEICTKKLVIKGLIKEVEDQRHSVEDVEKSLTDARAEFKQEYMTIVQEAREATEKFHRN